MNANPYVMLECTKNGRYFCFMIPTASTYQEALEVANEMVQQVQLMEKNDPRNKEVSEVPAEVVNEPAEQSAM